MLRTPSFWVLGRVLQIPSPPVEGKGGVRARESQQGQAAGSWLTQGWWEGVSEGRPWSRGQGVFTGGVYLAEHVRLPVGAGEASQAFYS